MRNHCLLLSITFAAFLSPACGQNAKLEGTIGELRQFFDRESPIVSFTAKARHRVQSDQIVVSAIVTTEGRQLSDAMEKNTRSREALNTALAARGIAGTNVVYKPFSFTTESGLFSKKVRNFKLASRLRITLTNETLFAAALQVLESRDEEWEFVSFESSDSREADSEEAAMEKALQEIERRKAFYEKHLGLTLLPDSFGKTLADGGQQGGGGGFMDDDLPMLDAMGNPISSSLSVRAEPSSFGEIDYYVSMTIRYRIRKSNQ